MTDVIILLAAAVIVVPISRLARLGTVPGSVRTMTFPSFPGVAVPGLTDTVREPDDLVTAYFEAVVALETR